MENDTRSENTSSSPLPDDRQSNKDNTTGSRSLYESAKDAYSKIKSFVNKVQNTTSNKDENKDSPEAQAKKKENFTNTVSKTIFEKIAECLMKLLLGNSKNTVAIKNDQDQIEKLSLENLGADPKEKLREKLETCFNNNYDDVLTTLVENVNGNTNQATNELASSVASDEQLLNNVNEWQNSLAPSNTKRLTM
ncbi:MAG: hypothetical protein KIT27_10750 [Legionellales bacterium]|nr:hypothetical protein [Legionellales bacterium]